MEPWKEKVALHLSLHGSNTLRGGKKIYNSNVLIGNWQNDRIDPYHCQDLTSSRVCHPQYPSVPLSSKYETTYMQGYDYEDWSKRPTKTSKFGSILAHDNSGPDSWTTESRFEYRNPVQRRDALIETGQWPYGREEEVCGKINGRRVRGGREEFLYLHPMPVHVSPTHEEDYLRSIEPRPPHEAVPPYMLPREEEEKEPHFTSPYASEDIVDRQPPSSSENSSSSSHLPPREIPSASSSPPHHPYAYPSPYGSELHAPSASPNVRFAEKG